LAANHVSLSHRTDDRDDHNAYDIYKKAAVIEKMH